MNQIIISCDFSMSSPGISILSENKYEFYVFPTDKLSTEIQRIYKESKINVVMQNFKVSKQKDLSCKERQDYARIIYLSNLIYQTLLKKYTKEQIRDCILLFEGSSYGSGSNSLIMLGTARFFMFHLFEVKIENIFLYSPMTIKSIAGCSKKGMTGKLNMVNSFLYSYDLNEIKENLGLFIKKDKVIFGLDDIADSYWLLKTHIQKSVLH